LNPTSTHRLSACWAVSFPLPSLLCFFPRFGSLFSDSLFNVFVPSYPTECWYSLLFVDVSTDLRCFFSLFLPHTGTLPLIWDLRFFALAHIYGRRRTRMEIAFAPHLRLTPLERKFFFLVRWLHEYTRFLTPAFRSCTEPTASIFLLRFFSPMDIKAGWTPPTRFLLGWSLTLKPVRPLPRSFQPIAFPPDEDSSFFSLPRCFVGCAVVFYRSARKSRSSRPGIPSWTWPSHSGPLYSWLYHFVHHCDLL